MNKLIALALLLTNFSLHAGILAPYDPSQSSSSLDWSKIDNEYVQVIYPSHLKAQASFIANLIEHYSAVSGETLAIDKPKKFPLILRPEFAQPNGFVTLGPRRSEWYTSSIFSPVIGGLNFYQSLAIHEYRHINQFDFMNRSTNKVAKFLFGDFGLSLAIALGTPDWFLEGDAVWAETAYSDAGRGRSPRFSARLKAMVLSDQLPTYDEFLGQTYKTVRPNHYVFGYYLVTRAVRIYGRDIWRQVLDSVTGFSFNPYAFTNAFRNITGVDFEDFFHKTLIDLRSEWRKDSINFEDRNYVDHYYPMIDDGELYYIKKDLNSFYGLYRFGNSKPLKELSIAPSLSKIDIKAKLLAYTQFLPSPRFSYKSYSDLFIYDIEKSKTTHVLKDQRVFHPNISPDSTKILVTKLDDQNQWSLQIIDLDGNELQNIAFKDQIVSEAVWKSEREVVAIVQKNDGKKRLIHIDIQSKKTNILINETRNNIFSLSSNQDKIYFEADYLGNVQVLELDLYSRDLKVCTREPIAAYNPHVYRRKLYFTAEGSQGKELKSKDLECSKVTQNIFTDFNYIGHTPSDDYTGDPPVRMDDFDQIVAKELATSEYSEFSTGLSPHSWSFFSGRGTDLSLTGNNYLNSFGYLVGVGQDAEEKQPFGYLSLAYTKYYPVFGIGVDYRKREETSKSTGVTSNWDELITKATVTLPYRYKSGLYNKLFELTGIYGQIKHSDDVGARVYELSDDTLDLQGGEFLYYSLKDLRFREIYPSYGLRYNLIYKKATANKDPDFSSEVLYSKADIFLPGGFKNSGLKISGAFEKQSSGFFNYRFTPVNQGYTDYVLSRGFSYSYIDQYSKASVDYAFPLFNTDIDVWGWAYLRRIYAKVFFDHTKIELLNFTDNLNSTGTELLFETSLFRKFELTFGVRSTQKLNDQVVHDFFLGSEIGL
tara:strand:- start:3723 stop:6518 length:2796 start_codon:yes stop_codon:yes gene_type:complete